MALLPAAGTSPFHCKGLVYQGAKGYFEKRIGGGTKHMALDDDALLRFWEQPFLAGGWYDALPIVALSRAAARAAGVPHMQLVKENAGVVAERDIGGVYKFLLKLASPELVAKRLPRTFLQYFDFGETKEETFDGRSFSVLQTGIPQVMGEWMGTCIGGFVPVALKLAGARSVKVKSVPSTPRVGPESIAVVDLRVAISWD